MTGTEVALIIGAVAALLGVIINAKRLEELREARNNDKLAIQHNRESLIRVGEQLALTRSDNAKLALLVKQLFEMYQADTGRKPAINWKNFDDMMAIEYITGPLGEVRIN